MEDDIFHNIIELNKSVGNFGKPYTPNFKQKLKTIRDEEGQLWCYLKK